MTVIAPTPQVLSQEQTTDVNHKIHRIIAKKWHTVKSFKFNFSLV